MNRDKEMYSWKKKKEAIKAWEEKCEKKSPIFLEARKENDFESCFHELCQNMDITIEKKSFVYFFDFDFRFRTSIANLTPNYPQILEQGIHALCYTDDDCSCRFCERYNSVVSDIVLLADRIAGCLKEQAGQESADAEKEESKVEIKKQIRWFEDIKDKKAETFEEALQRILFLNQLIWQTGGRLVGLGRLDMLLYPYYTNDIAKGRLTEGQAEEFIRIFLHILHENYWYKSNELLGDTGQIIILGGLDANGEYKANDLTYLFIKCIRSCGLSDPKIVLRTSAKMPERLMEEAVRCMATGIGSPLLSNDDVVIPKLLEFGVAREDAYAYTTSACWEPLIGGKSSSMNNQDCLVYTKALYAMLMEEPLGYLDSFETVKKRFLLYLKREVIKCERQLYSQKLMRNTLYSVFIEGCKENRKDITDGGAKYHNIGMTTVGLGNAVNALLNIEKFVFKEKRYSLVDVKKMCFYDYEGYPEAISLLSSERRYGKDTKDVIELSNEILHYVTSLTVDFRTPIGGKLKFGVSSPAYIMAGNDAEASFDGRKKGDPFVVHISNENSASYTELISFAAALDYTENRFNGNVVDFVVSPSFMERNLEKFTELLMHGTEVGYFQLQTNVINSDVLIEAKQQPEKFAGLIVRVWGFSAYFVELPESYQDLLIERALYNEGKTA